MRGRPFGPAAQTQSSTALSAKYADKVAKCANAEYAQWVLEWYIAAAQEPTASKRHFVYKRALDSLLVHPNKLASVRDILGVPGFGKVLYQRLEERHIQQYGALPAAADNVAAPRARRDVSKRSAKAYVPAYRSGAYAVLMALLTEMRGPDSRPCCTRSELVEFGQAYCEAAMDQGPFDALTGALKTLLGKELVRKEGPPSRYALTAAGLQLAHRLWDTGEQRSSAPPPPPVLLDDNDEVPMSQTLATTRLMVDMHLHDSNNPLGVFTWPQGSFDIVLLVDVREVKTRTDRDFFINRLTESHVACEQRNLDLGDFLWVARHKSTLPRTLPTGTLGGGSDACRARPGGDCARPRH